MRNLIYLLLLIFLFNSCSEDDNTNDGVTQLLQSEVDLIILPQIEAFRTEITQLQTAVNTFETTTTALNLTNLQDQWKKTAVTYEKLYSYNLGPIRTAFIHQAIYNWPVTTSTVDGFLNSSNTLQEMDLENISPRAKTFAAMEYLLFSEDNVSILSKFQNQPNRIIYLNISMDFLNSQSVRLEEIWSPEMDDYASVFVTNSGTGIDDSFNLFFNALYNSIDTAKVTKIGKPAGLENSSVVDPDLSQAHYSKQSLAIVKGNIEAVQEAYFNDNGFGIDDRVSSILGNQELNIEVERRFQKVYTAIDLLNNDLSTSIIQELNLVENLHTAIDELRTIFAVDLRSTLSIIITTTDNDGD